MHKPERGQRASAANSFRLGSGAILLYRLGSVEEPRVSSSVSDCIFNLRLQYRPHKSPKQLNLTKPNQSWFRSPYTSSFNTSKNIWNPTSFNCLSLACRACDYVYIDYVRRSRSSSCLLLRSINCQTYITLHYTPSSHETDWAYFITAPDGRLEVWTLIDCQRTYWRRWRTAGHAIENWDPPARTGSGRCCWTTCWWSAAAPWDRRRRPPWAADSNAHCCDGSRWPNCSGRPCSSAWCDKWAPAYCPPRPRGCSAADLPVHNKLVLLATVYWFTSQTANILQELISRLDSRTLRPVNLLGLFFFSNNIKNGISDIRDIKRRIMACLWNLG